MLRFNLDVACLKSMSIQINVSKLVQPKLKFSHKLYAITFMFVLSLMFTEYRFLHTIFSEITDMFLPNM